MLRVEVNDSANTLSLKLQGRLVGEEAKNTRTLMTRYRAGIRVVVDLTDVTFIDSVGEEALSLFGRFGAEFVAQTSYTLDVCERLNLCLARGETTGTSNNHRKGSRTRHSTRND